ncbi:GNAT family N-acetyltransferase [Enterovibrio paralichthyis]|uniref:GNAT family N-acetyltransferase n=1 Tax=Enterovibrio paralichthyis TaxID=2853805 RepID=UPI001C46F984|nr:GNAT family N-acetyltransferase [Enterovibrio paralichthyis]MBV7300329.1 GNAT family N-acetyltransferase [Enterovibrio paralichthyis]
MTLECRVVATIEELGEPAWNALLPDDNPFVRYAFLHALEQSGAVGGKSGWLPQYLAVFDGETLLGAAPCFLKLHPYGEYVFDWSWAEAYEDADLDYYPKLVCAIPFTPATGPRLLVRDTDHVEAVTDYLIGGLQSLAAQLDCSGAHVLFPDKTGMRPLTKHSFLERRAVQFHWFNRGYASFDDFLATLTARKRKTLRKERVCIEQQSLQVEVLEGKAVTSEHLALMYKFYQRTYLKRSGHLGYLNRDFFLSLAKQNAQLVLILAKDNGQYVAGSLYFRSKETLFGRFWGCLGEYEKLHFELCYYQGIEYCIHHRIAKFDAGAQGEHKLLRGFEPVFTYSAHLLRHQGFHQAIADYLMREHSLIEQYHADALNHLPFKQI